MKETKQKFGVRHWKMMEVFPLDEDPEESIDHDTWATIKEIKPKQRRVRKKRVRIIETTAQSTALVKPLPFNPELDTCRVYFDCSSFIDLASFIPETATKSIRSAVRTDIDEIFDDVEFYRNEMSCSWYGKMQVSREIKTYGRNGARHIDVLCFEFSVAKWWNFTSGWNSGLEPSAEIILTPCIQAMQVMNIANYSSKSFTWIAKKFLQVAEIRRFDLSLNFAVPPIYTPTDYVQLLSTCHVNRQDAVPHEVGSISFGTDKSPYRVICYDKEKEQEHYFHTKDKRPPIEHWLDLETGERFKKKPKDFKSRKLEHQVFDFNRERSIFYDKNKDKFKGNLRIEVQFRTKFIQEHNLMSQGVENIDNVIRLGAFYWREILDQFDEQLSRANFVYTESQKEPVCNCLALIEDRRDAGIYSRTKANNMIGFVKDCYKKGYKVVRDELGKSLFCQYSKWVRDETNYDVKVALPERLPIMRNMETLLISRQGRMIQDFRFYPSPVHTAAV